MRTFTDQVNQLQDTMTISATVGRLARLSRAAVRSAYVDIGNREAWNYLLKRTQVNTVAPYTAGSVQFTQSTGSIVLTGGTFPTWAREAVLLINRNIYAVQQRIDGTHLVLQPGRMPSTDLPAGTSYQLTQTNYDLPPDYIELRALIETERLWPIKYMPPEEMLARNQIWYAPSEILFYTVVGGSNGRMQLQFCPSPASARTYDMLYQGTPRPFGLRGIYQTGSATTVAGSPVVNFTGGVLPTNIAGCVFRASSTNVAPDGLTGDNPYVEEHVILQWNSATQATLVEPATFSATVGFTIDDPIDIEPISMLTYFDRMCESRLFRLHQSAAAVMGIAESAELAAYRKAVAADARLIPKAMQGLGGYGSIMDGFWSVTPREGT